jgi:2-desacetyl-2-hydroxyethyl bacteriochlorophyllide A dehydrogenase
MRPEQLWFTGPGAVEVRSGDPLTLDDGQVLVENLCSAVSAGTEMLIYRGQFPQDMALDANIQSLQFQCSYPLQYGYACVGRITQLGAGVSTSWMGKRVFAFQPHASHFVSVIQGLIPVPEDINTEDAVFLANMETAVNLVQDGSPLLGERVLVLGLGIVGLLLSSLLAQFPLGELIAADTIKERCELAQRQGVHKVFNPLSESAVAELRQRLGNSGCDLIYEVSGLPEALNSAINLSGFASRIVIGSWYGNKSAPISLGGAAHRNRLHITTSQVSSLEPELSGRWDKARRFDTVWEMLRRVQPQRWISHRVPLLEAPNLYHQLDRQPQECLQALFIYSHS